MPALASSMDQPVSAFEILLELDDAVSGAVWDGDDDFYVATASGEIAKISADRGLLNHWVAHEAGIIGIQLDQADNVVASAGEDGKVYLWDQEANRIAALASESSWIEHLKWNATNGVLAAATGKTIYLWKDTESLGVWYDASRHVLAMDWSPDGEKLATASNKGLYLWALGSEEPLELLSFPGAAVSVCWKPNGRALAVGTQDGFLHIWKQGNAKKGARHMTMSGYLGKVDCLDWHPQRDRIATAGGSDVVIWDMQGDGQKKALPISFHKATVTALDYASDGEILASGDRNGLICLWDDRGQLIDSAEVGAEITDIRWNSNAGLLIAGDLNGGLHLYRRAMY